MRGGDCVRVRGMVRTFVLVVMVGLVASCKTGQDAATTGERSAGGAERVGTEREGGVVAPTKQLVRPAGKSLEFGARPVDLMLSPSGATVYVKEDRGLVAIDAEGWTVRQELPYGEKEGGSMHGLAIAGNGSFVYVTTTTGLLREATVEADGKL